MKYSQVLQFIIDVGKSEEDFQEKVERLQDKLGDWDVDKLKYHLGQAGIIPEMYGHDSTEEKLYSKYCDLLLYAFFKLYGMESQLIRERGDRADVIGTLKNDYKIVADAKAFRLSRTALNVKDYKIPALNGWRENENADYACLVGPIHEFPKWTSRIYVEAVSHNVTLLSYPHLQFILASDSWKSANLRPLWEVGNSLSGRSVDAQVYWNTINSAIHGIVKSKVEWERFKIDSYANLYQKAIENIQYWENKKKELMEMSKEKIVARLLVSMKVESKIATIREKMTEYDPSQRRL